jgi:S1-C subfamily serine protease
VIAPQVDARRCTQGWRRLGAGLLALGSFFATAPAASAQADRPVPVETETRRNDTLADAFTPLTMRVVDSVCEVRNSEGHQLGYGVMVEPGWVYTALDVVGTDRSSAVLSTRRGEAYAEVAGRSPRFGVALLKVLSHDGTVRPLELATEEAPAVGRFVVSVATERRPLTVGVVSAKDRRVDEGLSLGRVDFFGILTDSRGPLRDFERTLQHDGAITDATLGTALIDSSGQLVGINVGAAYRGTSFAVEAEDLLNLLPHLKLGRPGPPSPPNGFLGVTIGRVHPANREELGVEGKGALIVEVVPGAPAEQAGLKVGDVVRSVEGAPIHHAEGVGMALRDKKTGETITIVVGRDGEDIPLKVTLGKRPEGR